jgi:choline-sulfatase
MGCPLARPSNLAVAVCCFLACGGEPSRPARLGETAGAAPIAPRPVDLDVESVLLVTVDTLRHDALGFAGNARVATPTLDRLAAEGVVFDRAYAHNVVTLPSHANILTGLLPYQHGIRDNSGFVLPASVPTAATLLAARGFATAAFVAAFPLDRRFGLDRGFDVYDDRYPRAVGQRPGDDVVALAVEWWSAHTGERRFLWVHLYEPHAPYVPPRPAADPYLGEVETVDRYLAPLVDPIREAGESTLVLFTGDHGEARGEHGELTHGLFAYEAVLRVPLVLWAPRLPVSLAGTHRADVAAHVDLLPTVLAALGVEPPPGLPGHDLLGGGTAASVYFEALTSTLERGWAPLRGVLDFPYKWIGLPVPELYDVATDPGETRNLVAERGDVARRLAAALPTESVWPPRRDPAAPEAEEALRDLGYLGGIAPRRNAWGVADDPKNLVDLDRKMHEAVDHFEHGRLAEAEALTREILAERDDMGTAYHYLALVLLRQERVPEAIEVMQRSRARNLASPNLLRQLGLSLAQVGRFDEARAVLEPLGAQGDPRALHDLASVLSEAGDQEGAARALEKVLERDPEDPEALQTSALVALRRGKPDEALALAEHALRVDDSLGLAWSHLGTAAHALGDTHRALEAWERAVALDPANFDALYNITIAAQELSDVERLRSSLEQFVATAPPRYRELVAEASRRLQALSP